MALSADKLTAYCFVLTRQGGGKLIGDSIVGMRFTGDNATLDAQIVADEGAIEEMSIQ